MNGFNQFLQLQKVDVAKREVWGIAAVEQVDRAREVMDYEKSLPNFLNWSRDMNKASGGLSQGNLRAMHQDVAAGKIIHLEPRDSDKSIYVGAKIVDDNEWKKVLEGVYTGFSVGGSYGDKWPDPIHKGVTRYEAKPVEISLVDVPCMPGAMFEVVKADGSREMRKLATGDLGKGDFEGHPFRGNQYSGGDGGSIQNTSKNKVSRTGYLASSRDLTELEYQRKEARAAYKNNPNKKNKQALKEISEDYKSAAAYHSTLDVENEGGWNTEVARGITGVSSWSKSERDKKIKELSTKSGSWTGMSLDTARADQDQYSQMLYDKFGEENVRQGNYPENFKHYERDLNAWTEMLNTARMNSFKSLSVAELLKEANMDTQELLKKLTTSSDPTMQALAEELIKAFPPAKGKKDEESEEAPAGDEKQAKPNPFEAKGKTAEGGEAEPDGDEGTEPEAESDFDGDEAQEGAEAEEQPEAGQPSPEQTEAIRAVVIQLLEELGFVQEQGGQPGAPTAMKLVGVETLQKRMESGNQELAKRLAAFTKRQDEITEDLAKLSSSVEDMEKRGGPAPVIRDLGALTPEMAGVEQQSNLLKGMIASTNDPTARQALQAELTRLEIKKVQTTQTK